MLVGQPKRTQGSAEGQPCQEWIALVTDGRLGRFRTGPPLSAGLRAPSIGAGSYLRKTSGTGGTEPPSRRHECRCQAPSRRVAASSAAALSPRFRPMRFLLPASKKRMS